MIEVDIQLPQKISANSFYAGMHWTKRAAIADDFHLMVRLAARQQGIGNVPSEWYPVSTEYEFFLGGKLDVSNAFGMIKLVEDGLVQTGVLEADDQGHVERITVSVKKPIKADKSPRVVVRIVGSNIPTDKLPCG